MDETLSLLSTVWPKRRERFTAIEASKMVGKLAQLAEGAPWVCYLVSHFYRSIAHALAQNKFTLERSSFEFQQLTKLLKNKDYRPNSKVDEEHKIIRFALKKAARMVHHAPVEYNIIPSMREELDLFANYLEPNSGVAWKTPIAFLIERTPFASSYGDACLDAAGGYLIDLKFWWHVKFPLAVVIQLHVIQLHAVGVCPGWCSIE